VAATTAFPEETEVLFAQGVRIAFNHYERAGESFAQRSWEALRAADRPAAGAGG
jgi:hypothetical protein